MKHAMIDGYCADESRLDDLKTVNTLLRLIAEKLNLNAAMPPFLLPYYYAKDKNDDGISAFTLLDGGHITIHTFPRRKCLFADVLYDGDFDDTKLRRIFQETFNYGEENEKCVVAERRSNEAFTAQTNTVQPNKLRNENGINAFGPHVIAKIENADITFERIFDVLDEMPKRINMNAICRPCVLKAGGYLSGIVLIAESHIAFHYSISERTLFCDLFSCSFYNVNNFTVYLERLFGKCSSVTLIRGTKYERGNS